MISIVTVVLNDADGLKKTIKSVAHQKSFNPNIEYIVIDGGSTDGSLDVIKANDYWIDLWTSGPDAGIYDAMNTGLRHAKGGGILFLNAGDYFVGDVLLPDVKVPSFLPVKYIDILGRFRGRSIESVYTGLPNCHQGIIFENRGLEYDLSFKICSDYKYYLDHGYRNNIPLIPVSGYVYFDNTGVNGRNVRRRDREIFEIRRAYFGFWLAYMFEFWPATKRLGRLFIGVLR